MSKALFNTTIGVIYGWTLAHWGAPLWPLIILPVILLAWFAIRALVNEIKGPAL
jgi:hypothetical protein